MNLKYTTTQHRQSTEVGLARDDSSWRSGLDSSTLYHAVNTDWIDNEW